MSAAVTFLTLLFAVTEQPVYLSSLPNIKDDPTEPTERHITTRDLASVNAFIKKWDRPGRGLFFCVGTINGQRRNKDSVAETAFLHTDIDFKTVDADEPTIREKIARLRYVPSVIVRSGNGLHLYWLLKEPLDTQAHRERIESALRQLADIVAGDLQVCEVSRLMRLPGSHNSKDGKWTEVVVEPTTFDATGMAPRSEPDDLEEWLSETAPVLPRKALGTSRAPRETNPYLEHAKANGFKPPLDVEEALASMTLGNVHATQLSVSASLLNAGRDVNEVIDILLDATRQATGDIGARWDWRRERITLVKMCGSWLAKHPRAPAPETQASPQVNLVRETATSPPGRSENVVAFARKAKQPKQKDTSAHIVVAETLMAVLTERSEAILFNDGGCYRYADHLWRLYPDPEFKAWLDAEIETAARGLRFETNNKLINETRGWIMRQASLHHRNVPWDKHGQVPTMSGLVHPRTLAVTPATPEHYCTWRIPHAYAPDATCPMWLLMLDDAFSDRGVDVRAETVALLQEMLGVGLIDSKAKALSQALVFEGGPDTGKSGLVEVLGGLFGVEHNTATFEAIGTSHGMMQFMRRAPWVLHEAFEQGKWHLSGLVKSIISGDPIQINVKYGPHLSRRFTAPIFWATNHPPQFKEATAAMINRTIVVRCRRTFDRDRPMGVALVASEQGFARPSDLVLATEAEGLLAWAVRGLRRALVRGSFVLPAETVESAHAIRRDSNLVLGFVEECIEFDPTRMVSVPDFAAAFASWWLENRGDDRNPPGSESVGRALRALGDARIASGGDLRNMARRYVAGVAFGEEGMRHWHNAVTSASYQFSSRRASTTEASGSPSVVIPDSWSERAVIVAMRVAQRMTASKRQVSQQPTSTEVVEPPRKPLF